VTVTPDDPLTEIAALAREMAESVCRRDPRTGESCAWYHGLWPDLRSVGLGASVSSHAGFFGKAFERMPRRRPRVLVSGAADHALLATVLSTCGAASIEPEVTVLDQCETPLRLNAWYAARAGRSIATCRDDVFEHTPAAPYDVVVASSFIGYFPPERRLALFGHWRSMLGESGLVAVVNRVRGGDPRTPVTFGPRDAEAFREAAEARLRPPLDEPTLRRQLDRVASYVRKQYAYPVSHEDLLATFAGAGLAVTVSTTVTPDDRRSGDIGGVAVASSATYACVVGTR